MKFSAEERIEAIEELGLIWRVEKYVGKDQSLIEDFSFSIAEIFEEDDETFRGKLFAARAEKARREEIFRRSFAAKRAELAKAWKSLIREMLKPLKQIFRKEK